jgi:hypothetical protein
MDTRTADAADTSDISEENGAFCKNAQQFDKIMRKTRSSPETCGSP